MSEHHPAGSQFSNQQESHASESAACLEDSNPILSLLKKVLVERLWDLIFGIADCD